jgi:hypothetical protein
VRWVNPIGRSVTQCLKRRWLNRRFANRSSRALDLTIANYYSVKEPYSDIRAAIEAATLPLSTTNVACGRIRIREEIVHDARL